MAPIACSAWNILHPLCDLRTLLRRREASKRVRMPKLTESFLLHFAANGIQRIQLVMRINSAQGDCAEVRRLPA
jgi:hypothetical protein